MRGTSCGRRGGTNAKKRKKCLVSKDNVIYTAAEVLPCKTKVIF